MNFEPLKKFMDHLTSWRIPGNSVRVFKDGREVFRYESGYSDLENKIPMQGNELFNIYSCSKVATVTAALQLYEQGKFLLDDPLYDFIPEFKDMMVKDKENDTLVPAESPITLRHLFTMTAGFTYNTKSPAFMKARAVNGGKMNTLEAVRCLSEDPLAFQPGHHFNYSICHDILAGVVEVISGKKFRDYVKENIFDPLGMTRSCYHFDKKFEHEMAQQYLFVNSEETNRVALQSGNFSSQDGYIKNVGKLAYHNYGEEYDSGGSGVITSVDDYIKFVAALANYGLGVNGERILSPGTVELLRTNQLTPEQRKYLKWPQLTGYGYGLGVRTMTDRALSGSNGSYGEFGWGGAAGATVLADPELNLAMFYTHHMQNPQETYYQPRLRNVLYNSIKR